MLNSNTLESNQSVQNSSLGAIDVCLQESLYTVPFHSQLIMIDISKQPQQIE